MSLKCVEVARGVVGCCCLFVFSGFTLIVRVMLCRMGPGEAHCVWLIDLRVSFCNLWEFRAFL